VTLAQDPTVALAACLHAAVAPYGFTRFEPVASKTPLRWVAAWKRKTWNTNRGIALISMPADAANAGEYALDIRKAAGRPIGYIPFLHELGLQLVLCGPGIVKKAEGLDRYVTKVNNSTVLLQSLHVVDTDRVGSLSVRTWGQLITGKYIDAIEEGISRFLAGGPPA